MTVYIARRESDGVIKIGVSRDVAKRVERLSHLHGKMELLREVPGDRRHERLFHLRFADACVHGEWFCWRDDMATWTPDPVEELPWAVRALRKWLDDEQRKDSWLAAQVPAAPQTLSAWLAGKYVPSPPARRRLADITSLPIDNKEAWE